MTGNARPPLSGRGRGFNSGVTMTPDQVTSALAKHRVDFPGVHADDLMAGVLAAVVIKAAEELADFILSAGQRGDPIHVDLMRKMRARGLKMRAFIEPMAPGEGDIEVPCSLPIEHADLEVIEAPLGTNETCGVMGCDRRATHVVRSMIANSGCWACAPHSVEIQAAIAKKLRGFG